MDQIVRKPSPETKATIEAALGLNSKGRSKRRSRRRWLYVLAAIVALGAAAGGYSWLSQEQAKIAYTTVPAVKGSLTVTVSATGTLQPLTQVDISSELSGVMRTVAVDENDLVPTRATCWPSSTRRDLPRRSKALRPRPRLLDARVDDARTTLQESEQALMRQKQLSTRGMVANQALETATATRDRAASAVKIAEANLAIAQAELKQRQTDVEKSTIYAPIDGIVLTRSVDPGQTVASSLQAPVLFIIAADLKSMELKAAIDEADIGGVAQRQKARFTVDAFPDRSFDALDPRYFLRLGHHRRCGHL